MPSLTQMVGYSVKFGFITTTAVVFTGLGIAVNAKATVDDVVDYLKVCVGV